MKLKKISEQTIVITGASSGIGLATARLAIKKKAKVVLAARSEDALHELNQEIKDQGGESCYVVADVGRIEDVKRIADTALDTFGRFDTWVNNAGVSIYGRTAEVDIDDMRRLFDTNFWGTVYGSLEALKHLRERGGALINIGSVLSDQAIVLQGLYSASKHAVKGFTDTLRMELENEDAPVSVTLIKPAAIDTPYSHNAKNYMDHEPKHAPPVYAPEVVARAILHSATKKTRELTVGGGGKGIATLGHHMPRLTDKLMETFMVSETKSSELAIGVSDGALHSPSEQLQVDGDYPGHVARRSFYTAVAKHPIASGAAVAGIGLAGAGLLATIDNNKVKTHTEARQEFRVH